MTGIDLKTDELRVQHPKPSFGTIVDELNKLRDKASMASENLVATVDRFGFNTRGSEDDLNDTDASDWIGNTLYIISQIDNELDRVIQVSNVLNNRM